MQTAILLGLTHLNYRSMASLPDSTTAWKFLDHTSLANSGIFYCTYGQNWLKGNIFTRKGNYQDIRLLNRPQRLNKLLSSSCRRQEHLLSSPRPLLQIYLHHSTERGGRPIKFEDAELEALLNEDSSQTQEELAETLGVTQQAISNRLKVMGMVQKQGNWVPYELKPGNIERRICTCELLLKRQNRKGFLHRIVTGDEKWIHYDNLKRRKSSVKPGHASTSTAKPNIHGKKLMLCIWWDQLGVIYYELLQPNETITGERYQQQLMRLSRALKIKRPLYAKRHDKVIYQHDNARPHVAKVVKETLEALQWDVLPHPLYSPDIAPSDYHMFRSMTHGLAEQHFTSYEKAKNWVNVWIASKDEEFFRHGIRMLPERWEKVVAKDGQYFE
ncbi:hypothetical protein LAZ67_11000877 [Cordylochernes scorpioides]|uniref:HTH cro/C1-type domain-containing protein n=1 Tax=Cordylochernes scorpioides TaxID=51811 RepID=A0ABY6L1X1_9ARAC|nr:hypothetical protein LAZ67_11000877 [Cordylochernes scorpioides]